MKTIGTPEVVVYASEHEATLGGGISQMLTLCLMLQIADSSWCTKS